MRIVVDHDLCEVNAVCVSKAPEVFSVDDRNRLHLRVEQPTPALLGAVERAVARCPRGALSLVSEGEAR